MPIGAIVGGVSAIAGGIASSKASSKAAKAQTATANQQIALAREQYDKNSALFAPDIASGNSAAAMRDAGLGIGGDPTAYQNALANFRNSSGYQDQLNQGLDSVMARAAATGSAQSGAALKALQQTGNNLASQSYNQYLGNLNGVATQGSQAKSSVVGVSNNFQNSFNQSSQSAADARSNNALMQGQIFNNALDGLYKSSFGGKK